MAVKTNNTNIKTNKTNSRSNDGKIKIGIIGGSGLDEPQLLKDYKEVEVETPYGNPSDKIATGMIGRTEIAILARHGKKHTINPTAVNYQANIDAFRQIGVTHIISATAVGSLRENIKPGDLVFLDQFIDRTTKRKQTFYEKNKVCHIPMAEPFCNKLRNLLSESARELALNFHNKGTVVTIEGPRFSTKAESHLFRSWNADVINMSTVPEVVLAREAGICYASIAMSTDYDCWRESEKAVSVDLVIATMKKNADNVKKLLLQSISKIRYFDCKQCREPINHSLL
ncbi:MAG TPA: S-methyl-5'-thioadenosine phosphorylase [Candidatus Nanoarchaeia archaeon]|nr:S-methyl-5'-thioadenosine phosphorylase [Candidatus Nanoarchaeia archaeon]